MAPIDLDLLRAFCAVVETGSFTGAAARLGHPRSTSSRAIAALEAGLGVTLFERTTRTVRATADARALYAQVAGAVGALERALAAVPGDPDAPAGTLRITATPDLASAVLAPAVARFSAQYPGVDVELHLSARVVDLVAEGFDVALRIAAGPLRGAGVVARRVGSIEIQLFASPRYLARAGTPRAPEDLARHTWIGFRGAPALALGDGDRVVRTPRPRIVCDDMSFAREAARHDAGVVGLPRFLADADLASGALVRVLPRWGTHRGAVYLVQPARRPRPARALRFVEVLREVLARRPLALP